MIDEKIFPFLAEKGHVISLVGGGGKTTLMYNLAAHCARKGWRVLAVNLPPCAAVPADRKSVV